MRFAFAILIGRIVRALARARGGKGSGVPGLVANRLAPRLLGTVLGSFPDGLVLVSGTAGKSTTTKMLASLLSSRGIRVFTNPSTANLPQGLTSAILEQCDWRGRISADLAVIELDEAHGAQLLEKHPDLRARVVVLTNVMLDDLGRFESTERVVRLLQVIAGRATEAVVLNADDAAFESLAAAVTSAAPIQALWYGVSQPVLDAQPHGLGYVRTASRRLQPGQGTIVEAVEGAGARLNAHGLPAELTLPARGTHYAVDAAAALEAARFILADTFDLALAVATLSALPPVFGRGETVHVRGQEVQFVLVQNTASFQLNVDALEADHGQLFVAIGSEEEDPSWLWTVDTRALDYVDLVSGSKAEEVSLRLAYDDVRVGEIDGDFIRALEKFLDLPSPASGTKTILFTASCMRRARQYLHLSKADHLGGVA